MVSPFFRIVGQLVMACTVVPEFVTAQVTAMFVSPGLDSSLDAAVPPGNGNLPYVAMSACARLPELSFPAQFSGPHRLRPANQIRR